VKIITPDFIYTNDTLLQNLAIAFDTTIRKIAPLSELEKSFPEAEIIMLGKNSLLMPGLINAHVHLEFSANRHTLTYGSFLEWLSSVIAKREELITGCNEGCIEKAIHSMLQNGITSFGAVSSYGLDLQAAATCKQNVVFFNEIIGSKAAMADILFEDFQQRLEASKNIGRKGFYPAVAVHSPYSVHPVLVKKALQIAKEENLPLSAHFLESSAEREWLANGSGEFAAFFEEFLGQNTPVTRIDEFLTYFQNNRTLMTHVVKADDEELEKLAAAKHTVIHCPISNRLLGNGAIDLEALQRHGIPWICATDGLSSNYKLDLFEEMKIALFMHKDAPLLSFAKQLLKSVTAGAADALGLNAGEIKEGKNADMLILDLAGTPNEQLPIHLILQHYPLKQVYINGELTYKDEHGRN
jgi:aminodeoxyfutalosine deaminase